MANIVSDACDVRNSTFSLTFDWVQFDNNVWRYGRRKVVKYSFMQSTILEYIMPRTVYNSSTALMHSIHFDIYKSHAFYRVNLN